MRHIPTRAQRICKYPGCNKVIPYGGSAYCEAHKEAYFNNKAKLSKSYDVVRPERHKFYHTARWRRTREAYIKNNPLCVMCLAEVRLTQGVIVDHIVEIQDGGDLTSPDNLQTLCRYHHNLKTSQEKKEREG